MIKKQNSEFLTAFTSEAAKNLNNTDCFAHVELDGYACYVLADGIDDVAGAKSARLCVDSVITSFTESPSMSKKALKKYIKTANEVLKNEKSKNRLKASIVIVVHNYVKVRYIHAGNVRFRIYKNGFLKHESKDQSLSMELVDSGKLEKDKVIKHEERHNLYTYLGQEKEFSPKISKKMKLSSSDAIALFTRGFWENVDDGEILDLFKDASDKPQETVDTAEDMLLSKQPEQLDAYSFVIIFVNKTFVDPNKKKRIKKIMSIVIPILIILLIIGIIVYNIYNTKQKNIALMNEKFSNAIQYIQDENYIRAQSMIEEAITYADKVKDKDITANATNYLMFIESVINADNNLTSRKYSTALSGYLIALDKSRYADNIGTDYINARLDETSSYIQVYDLISLGDTLAANLLFSKAEEQYLNAKVLSSKVYFDEGRQSAMQALETLYAEMQLYEAQSLASATSNVEKEMTAANLMVQAELAYANGDYEEAAIFYAAAMQKYEELGDTASVAILSDKLDLADSKIVQADESKVTAAEFLLAAEEAKLNENYELAAKYYEAAKDIYEELGDESKVAELESKIEIADLLQELQEEEAKAEAEAQAQAEADAKAEAQAEAQAQADKATASECIGLAEDAIADNDYDKAMVFYEEALEKYTELGDEENIKKMEDKINELQDLMDYKAAGESIESAEDALDEFDYDKALAYYEEALEKYKDLEDEDMIKEMEDRISETQKLIDEKAEQMTKAELYLSYGDALSQEHEYYKYDLAIRYYRLAINIYKDYKDYTTIAKILIDIDYCETLKIAFNDDEPENGEEKEEIDYEDNSDYNHCICKYCSGSAMDCIDGYCDVGCTSCTTTKTTTTYTTTLQVYNGYTENGTYVGHNGFDELGNYIGETGYNAKGENVGFGVFTYYGVNLGYSGYDENGNYTGVGGYTQDGDYIGYTANGTYLD